MGIIDTETGSFVADPTQIDGFTTGHVVLSPNGDRAYLAASTGKATSTAQTTVFVIDPEADAQTA